MLSSVLKHSGQWAGSPVRTRVHERLYPSCWISRKHFWFQFLEEVNFDPAIACRCCSKANEEQGWAPTANTMRITSDNLNQILGKPPKWEVLTYSHPIKTTAGPIRSPDAAPPPLRQLRQMLGRCSPRKGTSIGWFGSWLMTRAPRSFNEFRLATCLMLTTRPVGQGKAHQNWPPLRLWMSLGDEHSLNIHLHHLRIY